MPRVLRGGVPAIRDNQLQPISGRVRRNVSNPRPPRRDVAACGRFTHLALVYDVLHRSTRTDDEDRMVEREGWEDAEERSAYLGQQAPTGWVPPDRKSRWSKTENDHRVARAEILEAFTDSGKPGRVTVHAPPNIEGLIRRLTKQQCQSDRCLRRCEAMDALHLQCVAYADALRTAPGGVSGRTDARLLAAQ